MQKTAVAATRLQRLEVLAAVEEPVQLEQEEACDDESGDEGYDERQEQMSLEETCCFCREGDDQRRREKTWKEIVKSIQDDRLHRETSLP